MKYNFPIIKNVDDILPVIENLEEFGCFDRGGYLIANYVVRFAETFPAVNSVEDAIRRECRGITFDLESGDIIRRPYHKFFNINEIAETQTGLIDTGDSHVILEKMDGSMFAPFLLNGEILWGTKMGVTEISEPARVFVRENAGYTKLARTLLHDGFTPIFEWCSRTNRIVIDHPVDRLVLTAVRNMVTGEYMSYADMEKAAFLTGVPVVGVYDSIADVDKFIEHTRALDDSEGHVMRFADGHMLKFKSSWYCDVHSMKDRVSSERKTVKMILNNEIDDIKSFLNDFDVARLNRYEEEFGIALRADVERTVNEFNDLVARHVTRKEFALTVANDIDGFHRGTYFERWDKGLDFDTYYAKVKALLARDDLSNSKFREYKEHIFPEVDFYEE
jgi:T4 RnlA family RNA ligase